MNLRASCLAFELCGKFRDGGKPVSIFGFVPVLSHDVFWKVVKDGGDSHSGKKFDLFRNVSANLFQKRQSPEPTVADDQGGVFEAFDHSDDQFGADAGFSSEKIFQLFFRNDAKTGSKTREQSRFAETVQKQT